MTTSTADYCLSAQHKAETWLEELWHAEAEAIEMPAGAGDFCGCVTCIVREVLEAATPDMWRAFIELIESHDIQVPQAVAELL